MQPCDLGADARGMNVVDLSKPETLAGDGNVKHKLLLQEIARPAAKLLASSARRTLTTA